MFRPYGLRIWKKAPFIRLLLPFIAGIMLQWYFQFSYVVIVTALLSFSISFLLFSWLPISFRFKLRSVQGLMINLLLLCFGLLISWQKDIRHSSAWYGHFYKDSSYLVIRINEPLIEKPNSYKVEGYVESVIQNDSPILCKGKLLLYFLKDSNKTDLHYGDRIIFRKKLIPITNSGNPGAFNYQEFAAFQQIFHNVFLHENDWLVIENHNAKKTNRFQQFIFSVRNHVLSVLRNYVIATKDELGIAEALLIGYKNDLDKDIVQAYSNTGVVHLIAISGMHLGLIYVLLAWILARVPFVNRSKYLPVILTLAGIWLFALFSGASASVLRAAVMFSFIALGKMFSKQGSIINSLAASAFMLLCVDPFYLWNVGFQLSYLAVTGIVSFQKNIYHCIYIKNKWLDKIWQLMAVSLAAQILTFPVCIYYFHQFPNYFLISNIIAVPLAAVILYTGILLIAFSWIPYIGLYLGKLLAGVTGLMNRVIFCVNDLPFAIWDGIPASLFSTVLLYGVVIGFSAWLASGRINYLKLGMIGLLVFMVQHTYRKWEIEKQSKLIVYNVPRHQAIDFVTGSEFRFVGDSVLLEEGTLNNFHLKPGRIMMQLSKRVDSLPDVFQHHMFYRFKGRNIMIIDKTEMFEPPQNRINLDLVIISRNPDLSIVELAKVFNCKQLVIDASNPTWKIDKWQKECKQLLIPVYAIPSAGSFVYPIGI